nr:MAG TPA: hypothetical protein [Caudoviricetes sp.]
MALRRRVINCELSRSRARGMPRCRPGRDG